MIPLRALLDQSPYGMFVVDSQFRICEMNAISLAAVGEPAQEVIGSDFVELMHRVWERHYADEIVAAFRRTLETGEPYAVAERMEMRRDRKVMEYYEWRIDRLHREDGQTCVACYFKEISAQVIARRTLENANDALRAADMRKDEFMALLAHELGNPIAAVALNTMLLEQSDLTDPRVRFAAEALRRQSTHLQRLVEDLLDISRVSYGKFALRMEPLDLHAAAKEVLCNYTSRQDATLGLHGKATWILGDPVRVRQMIGNLVDNALKYGGRRIDVEVAAEGDNGRLLVRDDGRGLRNEFLTTLFKPFVQGHVQGDAQGGRQSGLGLGLALVDRLATLQGGRVEAFSGGLGQGSTFTLWFRRVEKPEFESPRVKSRPATSMQKILVVDDERDTLQALRMLLEGRGHEVITAETGLDALALIQLQRPDVALVNLGLPGMDGYEVARRVRRSKEIRSMRLIAITAYGGERDRIPSGDAGFDALMTKPVELEQLMLLLARGAAN